MRRIGFQRRLFELVVVAWVVGGAACQTTTPKQALIDSADAALTEGRYLEAARDYGSAAEEATDSDEQLRLQLFRLMANRAAASTPFEKDRAQKALKRFASESASTQWGRLAALIGDEIGRGDVMQDALLRVGVDLAELESQRSALVAQVAQLKALQQEQQATLEATTAERDEHAERVRDLEEQLRVVSAREQALVAELDALKRIDMQRVP